MEDSGQVTEARAQLFNTALVSALNSAGISLAPAGPLESKVPNVIGSSKFLRLEF